MKYWYNGNKWGGEIVLFTPQEAAELIPAKIKGESVFIDRLGSVVDTKQFESIEPSSRVYHDEHTKQLTADAYGAPLKSDLPKRGLRGGVAVQWVKKFVRDKEYNARDSYYKNGSGYYPLRAAEAQGGLFVVFSRPVYASGLPEGLEELETWEQALMQKRLESQPGWWNAA